VIGDATVRHSALASLAFEPDCLFRDKNSLTPRKARAEGLFGPVAESQRFPASIKAIGVVAVRSKPATGFALRLPNQTLDRLWSDRHVRLEQLGRQLNEFSPVTRPSNIGIYTSGETTSVKNPNGANRARLTKAQRIFDREHMNRPLGEYQKNMIDGVLKKYGAK
jgi:hypothetical protein